MKKDYALRILNNIQERIKETHYFKHEVNICRDLDRIKQGLEDGFN